MQICLFDQNDAVGALHRGARRADVDAGRRGAMLAHDRGRALDAGVRVLERDLANPLRIDVLAAGVLPAVVILAGGHAGVAAGRAFVEIDQQAPALLAARRAPRAAAPENAPRLRRRRKHTASRPAPAPSAAKAPARLASRPRRSHLPAFSSPPELELISSSPGETPPSWPRPLCPRPRRRICRRIAACELWHSKQSICTAA